MCNTLKKKKKVNDEEDGKPVEGGRQYMYRRSVLIYTGLTRARQIRRGDKKRERELRHVCKTRCLANVCVYIYVCFFFDYLLAYFVVYKLIYTRHPSC